MSTKSIKFVFSFDTKNTNSKYQKFVGDLQDIIKALVSPENVCANFLSVLNTEYTCEHAGDVVTVVFIEETYTSWLDTYTKIAKDLFAPMCLFVYPTPEFSSSSLLKAEYLDSSGMWPFEFVKSVTSSSTGAYMLDQAEWYSKLKMVLDKKRYIQYGIHKALKMTGRVNPHLKQPPTTIINNDTDAKTLFDKLPSDINSKHVLIYVWEMASAVSNYLSATSKIVYIYFADRTTEDKIRETINGFMNAFNNKEVIGIIVDCDTPQHIGYTPFQCIRFVNTTHYKITDDKGVQSKLNYNIGSELMKVLDKQIKALYTLSLYTVKLSTVTDGTREFMQNNGLFDFASFMGMLFEVDSTKKSIGFEILERRKKEGMQMHYKNFKAARDLNGFYAETVVGKSLTALRTFYAMCQFVKDPKDSTAATLRLTDEQKIQATKNFGHLLSKNGELEKKMQTFADKAQSIEKMSLGVCGKYLNSNVIIRVIPAYREFEGSDTALTNALKPGLLLAPLVRTFTIKETDSTLLELYSTPVNGKINQYTSSILGRTFLAAERMGRAIIESEQTGVAEMEKTIGFEAFLKAQNDRIKPIITAWKRNKKSTNVADVLWRASLGLKANDALLLSTSLSCDKYISGPKVGYNVQHLSKSKQNQWFDAKNEAIEHMAEACGKKLETFEKLSLNQRMELLKGLDLVSLKKLENDAMNLKKLHVTLSVV